MVQRHRPDLVSAAGIGRGQITRRIQSLIQIGDVDLKALEDIRRNWPFLRDRRIDAYAPISNRFLDGR